MNKSFGLRQQLAESQSVDEVNVLLTKSKSFELASERTRRSWKYTAKRTLTRLNGTEVPSADVKKSDNIKKKNYKKSK